MLALDGVHFTIGEKERRLRFTYAALLALYEQWGEEFERRVATAIVDRNVSDLSHIVAFTSGTAGDEPMTYAEVMAACPPIIPLCAKLEVAWAWAYHGFEAAKQFQAVAEREAKAEVTPETKPKKWTWSRFISEFGTRMRTPSEAA